MKFMRQILILASISLLIASQTSAQEAGNSSPLSELEQVLNTEISTASRYGQKTSEAPSSVSIITAEDIERYGYKTLADALNSLSGFYYSYDRNYTFMGTRGFGRPSDFNNRIRILLNGHSIYEAMDGTTFAGNELAFSLDAVERVEVVRGPGSALYGTGAMFAVINIITRDCKTVEGLIASSSTGSFGSREIAALFSKRLSTTSSFMVSGRVADNDGQSLYFKEFNLATSNNGLAERRDWEKGHALVASAKFGDFGIETMYSSREKGIPTASYETIFNAEQSRSVDAYGFVDVRYSKRLTGATELALRGYFDKYVYRGWWPYEEDNTTRDETNGESLGGEAIVRIDASANNRILAAAEFQTQLKSRYRNWGDFSGLLSEIDEPLDVLSLTLQDEYRPLHSLSLFAGFRHDQYQNQDGYTAPRIGVVFSPTDHTSLKALYGRAFRVATSYERFWKDSNAGFKANPSLEAENILTREFAVEHQVNRVLQLTTSIYSYSLSGLADYVIDPADSLTQLRNLGSVDAIGGEFALRAEFSHSLSAFANCTIQKTEDTDRKERLSNSPTTMVKVGFWSAFLRHFSGSAILRYESERTTVYETKTGSFLLADLQLAAQPKFDEASGAGAALNKFKLALLVRNALNESYSYPGGFEHVQDAIPQDGRTFQVKLTYQL